MQKILREIPESFETERLLLRCPRAGDGAVLYEAASESADELRLWLPWMTADYCPDDSEAWVRRMQARFIARETISFLLFLKGEDKLVGGCGLIVCDWEVPKFEIGYWARTSQTGHGYITEAVNGVLRLAIDTLGANRLEIRCDTKNDRSAAVAKRVGFVLEGTLRCDTR